jgi:penicillin-binding protein A
VRSNIRNLGLVLVGCFALVSLTLGFWQVVKAPELDAAANNPRTAEAAARVLRGALLDRNGQPIARSELTPQGVARHYASPAFSTVTGYFSQRYGASNIEAAFDGPLRGDRSPDLAERLRSEVTNQRTIGSDVMLTIDARIQQAAAEAMGNTSGAVVALDPRTGQVLALVSTPLFDPNRVDQDWDRLRVDPGRPLFNRAVQSTYVPGSTFKTIVDAAALELNVVDPEKKFTCTTPIKIGDLSVDCRNHSHLPVVNFYEAFAWSCNRTFALTTMGLGYPGQVDLSDTARRPYLWEEKGFQPSLDRLRDFAHRFGFERSIPFDLEVAQSRLSDSGQQFFPSLLGQTGFGQGQVAATPMQMALVAATIANGGAVPSPYLVSQVRAPSGSASAVHQPGGWIDRAVSQETAAKVNRGLELGVETAYAQKASIPGVKVAGKTGTAEVGSSQTPNSWFIGYAPSDNPRVAVAVVMENMGSGSDFATPAGQRVLLAALNAYKPER